MIRTRVGYSGGTKLNPTYRGLGDHTETIQIDYDPARISYEKLLDIFWNSHEPTGRSWSKQYRNVIFYHDARQKLLAEQSRDRIASRTGGKVRTDIEPATAFYPAEDYHQKFRLQQDPDFMREFDAIYPNAKDFMNSTATARVNGYLGGYGTSEQLKRELEKLGMSQEGRRRLTQIVGRR